MIPNINVWRKGITVLGGGPICASREERKGIIISNTSQSDYCFLIPGDLAALGTGAGIYLGPGGVFIDYPDIPIRPVYNGEYSVFSYANITYHIVEYY